MANSTAETIIGYASNICKVDGNSSGIPGLADTDLLAALNRANSEYIEAPYMSGGSSWEFMELETGYTVISDTALAANVASGATTLTVDSSTSWAASNGAAVIYSSGDPDIFEYTAVSSGSATGVPGIGFAHTDGDNVSYLYPLPSNFGKMRPQEGYGDGVRISGVPYFFASQEPIGFRYSIYDNGTSKWLWLPRGSSGTVSVIYDKAPTTIDGTADTVDVPVGDEDFLIYRLVAHIQRTFNSGDVGGSEKSDLFASRVLLEALKRRNMGKRVRLLRKNRSANFSIDGGRIYYWSV